MSNKKQVAILFGGRSAEHEVSLLSAKNVIAAIDRDIFNPILIAIDKMGRFSLVEEESYLQNADDPKNISLVELSQFGTLGSDAHSCFFHEFSSSARTMVDVVFPVLHGTFGEDGTMQGMLQLLGVPFVGPDLLGSSVAMDKDISKRLLAQAGIPVCPWQTIFQHELDTVSLEETYQQLGPVLFVKPANLGSSVGITRAQSLDELRVGVERAFEFDLKVIVESAFPGREIECAVLGNEAPKVSVFGEIIPADKHGFYSYEAKYIDPDGAALVAPVELDTSLADELKDVAIESFKALGCEGMSRVDFLLAEDGKYVVNELNTIPGFTKISMYPRLWGESGLSYQDLITELINLGIERFDKRSKLSTQSEL